MTNTNYIVCIVKILETPKEESFNDKISTVQLRAQLLNKKNSKIVHLVFWGNLARDVKEYYKINDFLIIEGHISLCSKKVSNPKTQNSRIVNITVLRTYPFFLSSNR